MKRVPTKAAKLVPVLLILVLWAALYGSGSVASGLPKSALISEIQKRGVLRAGIALFLPIVGQDPSTGQYFGTGVDIANLMAQKLGVKVQFIPQEWNVIVAAIQAKKIDVAVAGLYATPERLKVVEFTNYIKFGFCYAVLKTNTKVNTLADLNSPNVTFAQQEGGGTYQLTKAKYPLAQQKARIPAPGEVANFSEVVTGEADVVPFDSPLVDVVKQAYPQFKIIPDNCGLTNSDIPSWVGFAYEKGDDGFKQFADDLVNQNQSAIQASLQKYSGPQYLKLR